jgi:hypothetical protein
MAALVAVAAGAARRAFINSGHERRGMALIVHSRVSLSWLRGRNGAGKSRSPGAFGVVV